jgi:fumarylacetoacetate (FAA) hydrolase
MQFDFAQLIAHAAKTRPLSAGTIVGSGTVANEDTSLGASCFAEQRTVETLRDGKPSTPFMAFGDRCASRCSTPPARPSSAPSSSASPP